MNLFIYFSLKIEKLLEQVSDFLNFALFFFDYSLNL